MPGCRRARQTWCWALGQAPVRPLASHPDVDLVSFTGGVVTGRAVMAAAAATVKKVALELGGKNPNIVFADSDWEAAIDNALTAVFLHSGQVCSAGARLIVEESIHDKFIDEVVRRAQLIRLGGPDDASRRDRTTHLCRPPRQGRLVRGCCAWQRVRSSGAVERSLTIPTSRQASSTCPRCWTAAHHR